MAVSTAVPHLPLRARVTCPHCWHEYAPQKSLWIATSATLRGDSRLGDQPQRFSPTRFTPSGDAIDANGGLCRDLACPNCHLVVPRSLLEMEPLFLSILGTPSSGKSFYLSTTTWRLRRLLPAMYHLSFGDSDSTLNAKLNQYEELLFLNAERDQLIRLEKTQTEGEDLYDSVTFPDQTQQLPRPFVFDLRPLGQHPNVDHAARLAKAICLYDNAGEHFLPGADRASSPVTQHLAVSKAIFFLFDPTQDPDFRDACRPTCNDPQIVDSRSVRTIRQETVLREAANRVRKLRGLGQTAKHKAPLIVIVGKFDTWGQLLPEGFRDLSKLSYVTKNGDGPATMQFSVIEEMSKHVRELLWNFRSEFVATAEAFCENVIYIPCSALGGAPVPGDNQQGLRVRPRDIQPQWVEVPILYALARWQQGLIQRKSSTSRPRPPVQQS